LNYRTGVVTITRYIDDFGTRLASGTYTDDQYPDGVASLSCFTYLDAADLPPLPKWAVTQGDRIVRGLLRTRI
jgi:hypothetical protein